MKKAESRDLRKILYYIYRTWITRDGVRVYASQYGFKAWRIPIYQK